MKILSIGNSFSFDAQRYLHSLAKHDGTQIKTVNLFIGGCSLRTHYLNALQDLASYTFCFNGEETGIKVSIAQALASDDWDIVTLQQASQFSPKYETYSPYLESLAKYVKKYCPNAKLYIHETWGYEDGSERLKKVGYESEEQMYSDIHSAYQKSATLIQADGIIPCGKAMLYATKFGVEKIRRDTFHASLGAGRYLLALTWYKMFTGKDITNNDFDDFDVPVSQEERDAVIKAVNLAFEQQTKKKMAGKTFLFLGDSLTEGVRGTTAKEKGYPYVFANLSGATVYEYGVGGTRLAYQKKPTLHKPRHDMYFASRVLDMRKDADYVVVFGGSNDFAGGDAPLGKFGDTTPETFYGALHDLYTRLQEKYPQSKLFTVTPLHRGDIIKGINAVGCERNEGIEPYVKAIKQVAKAFDIVVIDAHNEWAINPLIDEQRTAYFSADAIHPNDNGHRFIAERFVEFFENFD